MSQFDITDIESISKPAVKEIREKAIEKADYFADLVLGDYSLCITPEFEVNVQEFESTQETRENLEYNEIEALSLIAELVGLFRLRPEDLDEFSECMPPNIHPDTELSINSDKLEEVKDDKNGDAESE